ncbi:hypothetical protein JCGZ_10076 [Jatropha curcas]|uniref:BURP domain-containing protein n=1 Tax=Jatropha curcas TaxID=180498 RepID=A0A067LCQ5_JATCU|nr:BURP domain-containing protein BNM2A [Jatropha curcas]KDP46236.1 hypothetical protein JCGZ_10076 [Jatropha curcas]
MAIYFYSWRIFLCVLLLLLISRGMSSSARKMSQSILDNGFQESSKDSHLLIKNGHFDHQMHQMDPSLNVFFTINDLKPGKIIPIYFPKKHPSISPHLLSREETNSIPFSLTQLSYLLELFSFSKDSPQAKAMEYTLKQCETEPVEGETKYCATSLESMLDFVVSVFGSDTKFKALTTNYLKSQVVKVALQNYTIVEEPKEILAERIVACHVMPYPFVVYYCHSREGGNRLFEMLVGGEDGETVEAAAICHMDTSQWDKDHVSFRLLNIKPGTSPVCHFLPADNVVWVPLPVVY